jgi:hypothetical protein
MLNDERLAPHEYLMSVGSDEPGLYRCLICDTWLRCEFSEATAEVGPEERLSLFAARHRGDGPRVPA